MAEPGTKTKDIQAKNGNNFQSRSNNKKPAASNSKSKYSDSLAVL